VEVEGPLKRNNKWKKGTSERIRNNNGNVEVTVSNTSSKVDPTGKKGTKLYVRVSEPGETQIYAAQKVLKTRENTRNYAPLATAGDRIPNPDVKIKSFRIPRKDFKKYDSLGVPQHGSEGIPKTGITFADQKAGPNAWELEPDRYTYLAKQAVAGSYEEVRPWVNNLPDCALRQMKQHRKAYKKGRSLASCTANTIGIAMAGGGTRKAEDAAPKPICCTLANSSTFLSFCFYVYHNGLSSRPAEDHSKVEKCKRRATPSSNAYSSIY